MAIGADLGSQYGASEQAKPMQSFAGEASRSKLEGRYDLIPREAIDAIARRLQLGAERRPGKPEDAWKNGGEEFRKATINHLFNHLLDYLQNGNESEANTDAIICNAAFLCFFEAKSAPDSVGAPPQRPPDVPLRRI